jgi:tetratricopeptide (TPR) repeat protein
VPACPVVALAGILFCCPYVSKVTPLCNTLSAVYLKEGALADIHLTRELLRAVARGDMPPRVLVEFGLQHLTSLCPACREEYLAWKREQSATVDYDSTFRVLPLLVERHQAEVKDKGEGVERDLRTLLRYAHSTRLAKIRRANTRFRGTLLASLLLEESKKQMAGDPQRADELAETAEVVLSRTRESPGVADLSARAAAYRANVYRLRGNPREARKHFDFARYIIRNRGVTDPLVYAEVDSCEAVLDMEQSRFGRAEELLTRAIALYSLGGAREQAAHPLVTLGLMYYHQGDSAKAVEFTQAAVDAISPERDRRLYLSARYNLSLYLCEAGYYHAAAETLLTDRDLYAQFQDPYTQLRLVWLEGKIAAGFEKFEELRKRSSQRGTDSSNRVEDTMPPWCLWISRFSMPSKGERRISRRLRARCTKSSRRRTCTERRLPRSCCSRTPRRKRRSPWSRSGILHPICAKPGSIRL